VLVPGLLRPLVPPADLPRPPAGPVTLLVRPEQLDLQPAGSPVLEGVNAVRGVVAQIAYAGSARKVIVDVEGRDPVIVRFGPKHVSAEIEVGCDVDIVWRAAVGVLIVPRTDEAEDGARETLAQRAFERSSQ
jgi:TOBE domain